ncbi:MAG: glycolate oxidase subunit GlcF [Acuticoccus sp.]
MQTHFSEAQRADPAIRHVDTILRACVHCGFCTATCPTFALLGDECDSPRGRIYLIKDMLENERAPTESDVRHVDRCLSCLACMTTCPSGVNYMHLVDHARTYIEEKHTRPLGDRLLRGVLAAVLPHPRRFRLSLTAARLAAPLATLMRPRAAASPAPAAPAGSAAPAIVNRARRNAPGAGFLERVGAMLALAPRHMPPASAAPRPGVFAPEGPRRARVALLTGCAQSVLAPSINEATIRVLNRAGVEVVLPQGEGCCGALVHHMGKAERSHAAAKANIDAWQREIDGVGLDAIIITASGCGTTIKDYGFMLSQDPAYADKAARISALAKDITEFVSGLDMAPPVRTSDVAVAYHSACSMQHGQKIRREPKALLEAAGFTVRDVAEGHLCCGSAGTYNIMQPGIAAELKARKLANLDATGAGIVATGNIGCMTQLGSGPQPVVHTIELIDWAQGGPEPAAAQGRLTASAPPVAA